MSRAINLPINQQKDSVYVVTKSERKLRAKVKAKQAQRAARKKR